MVNIRAEDWRDEHGQQWEYGKDRLCRLTHVAHITIGNERNDADGEQTVFHIGLLLEIAGETSGSHNEHDDILYNGNVRLCPERIAGRLGECQVALQHVDSILLEGEDG